ncbi:MAG: hypothetical protein DI547_07505 [Sphingobium sp.]|nr:MAG: hypothetical protein DI547_07505 [Sphingobium sp.]
MTRSAIFALLAFASPLALTAPALAQDAAPAATAPATPMTQEQIAAFNQAVSDFTAGQTAQQAGDNAGAIAKYNAALPAIRTAVQSQPDNIDNVAFLANTLYATAAAHGALQQFDQILPLFEESAPLWRKVVAAKPADAASRNVLAGVLVQLGNAKLTKQDKAGADPLYAEALTLARKSVAEQADAASNNLLLSALIGSSQTSTDPKVKDEAVTLGKKMVADGTIDASNKPSIDILAGTKAAG